MEKEIIYVREESIKSINKKILSNPWIIEDMIILGKNGGKLEE